MTALAGWYPGDGVAFAGLEVLSAITVLVALSWAAERFGARRHAALRSALWLSALAGVLLAPALVLAGRQLPWRIVVLPSENTAPGRAAESPPTAVPASLPNLDGAQGAVEPGHRLGESGTPGLPRTAGDESTPSTVLPEIDMPSSRPPALPPRLEKTAATAPGERPALPPDALRASVPLVLLVWGVGSVYLTARLLHGWRRVRRLLGRLHPLDGNRWAAELEVVAQALSVVRLPDLCLSPNVRSPLVAGLFSPRVVLPETLPDRSTAEQFRAILLHECAHVVRRDPWVRLLQNLAAILFWAHPLVHLLNRRLDHAREELCDNHVLACVEAPAYAETLLEVARICYPLPRLEGYLTMIPQHDNLERRIADLLEERRDTATRLSTPQRLLVLTALVLILAAVASVGLHGTARAQDDKGQGEPAKQAPPKEPAPAAGATRLQGTVLTADGAPAAGAAVWASKMTWGPLEHRETVADVEGRYVLQLDPGEWHVSARRGTQGGAAKAGDQDAIEIVAGRVPHPVSIRLEERGTLRGRLLEAESNKPLAGGRLCLDAGLVLTADADGRFEVGGLSRGAHESFVVAAGRQRLRVLFDTTGRADTELEVAVPRSGKIVGRVTDLEGKPIPGAYVGRSTSGSYFSINALFLACNTDGHFEYDDAVPPDQPTRLLAAAPGYVEDERGSVTIPSDGKPLELAFRLRPTPSGPPNVQAPDDERRRIVSGVVLGPDKKPAADVLIQWGYEMVNEAVQTRTDAEGRFRLTVPDKANLLAVLPREHTPQFPHVAAGGDQKVEVTLDSGHTAGGRVLDDTGKPVKGVEVIAMVASPDPSIGNPYWLRESAAYTDAAGKFLVKGVPADAQFDFLKQGLSDVRNHTLNFDGADNTVTVSYGGAISGRVVDRDGKPIRNFRILVNFPKDRQPGDQTAGFFAGYTGMGVRFTSADGSFVLTGVGAGSVYRITALADGHGEAMADRVPARPVNRLAEAQPVTLCAGPPVSLRVRAVTKEGKPIAGARVTLVNGAPGLDQSFAWGYHDASWEDMVRRRTGADGWAEFSALSFGSATVLVQAPGYARERAGWRDGRNEWTAELSPEAVVAGEVHDAAGKPVKEFYVSLSSGGDQVSANVDPEAAGRFRIGELPAGTWTVLIPREDGRTTLHQEEVTVKAREKKELKIETKKE